MYAAVIKDRVPKRYRHPQLDHKLTVRRVRDEARMMARALRVGGVDVPALFAVDVEAGRLVMEWVEGWTVKTVVNGSLARDNLPTREGSPVREGSLAREGTDAATTSSTEDRCRLALAEDIGRTVARLHDAAIIHGDLTTSNMLVRRRDGEAAGASARGDDGGVNDMETPCRGPIVSLDGEWRVACHMYLTHAPHSCTTHAIHALTSCTACPQTLIDFGLSYSSTLVEDKAVDLYVLERALLSTHPRCAARMFDAILDAYVQASVKHGKAVRVRFEQGMLRQSWWESCN